MCSQIEKCPKAISVPMVLLFLILITNLEHRVARQNDHLLAKTAQHCSSARILFIKGSVLASWLCNMHLELCLK